LCFCNSLSFFAVCSRLFSRLCPCWDCWSIILLCRFIPSSASKNLTDIWAILWAVGTRACVRVRMPGDGNKTSARQRQMFWKRSVAESSGHIWFFFGAERGLHQMSTSSRGHFQISYPADYHSAFQDVWGISESLFRKSLDSLISLMGVPSDEVAVEDDWRSASVIQIIEFAEENV
jgi:hypothetical protein